MSTTATKQKIEREKFEFHLFKPGNPSTPRSEISYFATGSYSASAHKSKKEKARKAAEKEAAEKATAEAKRIGGDNSAESGKAYTQAKKKCIVIGNPSVRSEEHTSELQSQSNLVCRLL